MSVKKCIPICETENKNSDGAFRKTSIIEPAAPDAAKNICMNKIPMAVPVALKFEKNFGKDDAPTTVRIEINGRLEVPAGRIAFVKTPPMYTKNEDTAKDELMVDKLI